MNDLFTQASAVDQTGPEPGPKLQKDRLPALPKVCDTTGNTTVRFTWMFSTFFPHRKDFRKCAAVPRQTGPIQDAATRSAPGASSGRGWQAGEPERRTHDGQSAGGD